MKYEDYVDLKCRPSKSNLICEFFIEPNNESMKRAAGAVAAESSTGTWTKLTTITEKKQTRLGAKVFEINGKYVKIAYPVELFEPGNMPQIFSSIAGNVFGMKEISNLRLLDVTWPKKITDSFKGPQYGVDGVRKLLKVKKRPLCGTIIKPKLGLNEKEHAKVAYEAWIGGLDIVKDDENLSSQSFNNFYKRAVATVKMKDKAERETGERKMYMCNVTAETKEMLKRAKFLKDIGNEYAMIDILTVGWSGLQTLRNEIDKLKLVLHGHRAMHAALTRNKKHGISMVVLAEAARLIGIDQLHIGTAVGKMEGGKEETITLIEDMEKKFFKGRGHVLAEKWGRIKPVFAVCSGGLQPMHIPNLVRMFGKDIIIQAGGGVHGNPLGTRSGAMAMRQSIDAAMKKIPLNEYSKNHKELRAAMEKWGSKR
jgi:ribulose-bisphosphate carboxylase large chain